jgi:hypothetical protein
VKAEVFIQDYVDLLIQKAGPGSQRHPSHHMLDRIEGALSNRAMVEKYLDAMLDMIEKQRYPSLAMLDRITRVISALQVVDELDELAAR